MNSEEIIEMAIKLGAGCYTPPPTTLVKGITMTFDQLEAFAKLVAAKEREACVNVIETHRIPVGNSAAGEMACEWTYDALKEIRTAIRARGEA